MRGIYRAAFTAAIWFVVPAGYAGSGVSLSLSHDGRDASAANSVALSLSNGTDHDIFVYGYNSVFAQPDGRTTSNWLSVTDAFGHEVPYKGRYVVMGPPPPSLFIRIRSGEHLDAKVDLSREYDLPPAGSVTVKTSVAIYERVPVILPSGESESIPHESIESKAATFVAARAGVPARMSQRLLSDAPQP